MKTYTGKITSLKGNQIFVFGTNTQGRHGKGAAEWAAKHAGAMYGKSKGLMNQCYGIVTKDLTKFDHPSISLEYIIQQVRELYKFAVIMPDLEFMVAYSTEPNLNGYTPKDMAWCFRRAGQKLGDLSNAMNESMKDLLTVSIPRNIIFEEGFSKLVFNLEVGEPGIIYFTNK